MPTIPAPTAPKGTRHPSGVTASLGGPKVSGVPLKQNLVDNTAKFISLGKNPK